jgi:hypothetical protein
MENYENIEFFNTYLKSITYIYNLMDLLIFQKNKINVPTLRTWNLFPQFIFKPLVLNLAKG